MYTLVVNKVLQYKLILDNFTKQQSLSFRINETFLIYTQGIVARLKSSITINVNNRLRFLSSKLISKSLSNIRFRMISINFIMKFRTKLTQLFSINIKNNFLERLKQRVFTIINIPNKIIYSPLLGKFFPLSAYDPLTLGSLDGITLRNMDFVEY